MGEVYRARDTTLGRDVALKTLPEAVTHDAERLARFRREAQLLAALNHPNIASIYGIEESGGQRFLVLELVEGETLAARLARGALQLDEALAISQDIAEALQSAHEKGIVHRDLKPANIALTTRDRVKLLDFGLAKATDAAVATSGEPLDGATITSPAMLTGMNVILGTAAYMSPEQARGRDADRRSDIWSFGCVLYEMLAGKRAFEGGEVTDTLAAVLKSEPDWSALPPAVPPAVRSLIEGCLEKQHRQRISDISTILFVLRQQADTAAAAVPPPVRAPRRYAAALFVAAGAVAGAAAAVLLWPRPAATVAQVAHFEMPVADRAQLTLSRRVIAVSPDGTHIVYVADGRLYLRSLSDVSARPIPGAETGVQPAFSPDGQWIVFWADPSLRRIAIAGGVPVTVCNTAPAPFGVQWHDSGIIFIQQGTGILRVSANGGTPTVLVRLTLADGIAQGAQLLPDGDRLLFTLARAGPPNASFWDEAEIVVQSLKTGQRRTIIHGGSNAVYVPTGHIIYTVEGTLMGVAVDPRTLEPTSGAVPLIEGVRRSALAVGNAAQFDLSNTGLLAYVPGAAKAGQDQLFVYDRQGSVTALKVPLGSYLYPRVSPDGKRIAVETNDGKNAMISLYDLSGTSSLRRLTFGGNNRSPVWSGDGTRVAFQSDREGDRAIFWQPVNGGPAERLTRPASGISHLPEDWSSRDNLLLFSATNEKLESTLWVFDPRDRRSSRFSDVQSTAVPPNAAFRPDGRWVAYQSGDLGMGEATTYVEPFPPTGTKYEIARGGRARWSPDGKQVFLVPAPGQFVAVSVTTDPVFGFSAPVPFPRRFGLAPPASPRPYDILPDGRILAVDAVSTMGNPGSPQIHVVLNWFEELKRKLPAK
jgi:serine/threonine-protein kinase